VRPKTLPHSRICRTGESCLLQVSRRILPPRIVSSPGPSLPLIGKYIKYTMAQYANVQLSSEELRVRAE
jgi:hypothetical protein